MNKKNIEIEAHFLDVNPSDLHKRLIKIGAKDLGEDFLKEVMFYDKDLTWKDDFKFIRMRVSKTGTYLSYKHFQYGKKLYASSKPVVKEVEIQVDNPEKAHLFLEEAGFIPWRKQEKKRHTYTLDTIEVAIDTWPSIPPYVEIEGDTEKEIRVVAEKLGFNWKKAIFRGSGFIIERYLPVKVRELRYLTFEKIE